MAIRMGYWDCGTCGQKKIPGPERNCSSCGATREANVQFYTDDAAPEVKDAALLARAKAGGDWTCEYCSTESPATATACVGCGAPRDGAKGRQAKVVGGAPKAAPVAPPPPPPPAPAGPPAKVGPAALIGCLAVVGILFAAIYFLFIKTKDVVSTVQTATWVKSIQLEELKTERKEDWKDSLPSGAMIISQTTKSRQKEVQEGTTRVKTGTKDLGNGMFEDVYEDKPNMVMKTVQDTWVVYEVQRWIQGKKLKEEKTDDSEPPWPAFTATPTQREKSRSDELLLDMRSPDGTQMSYTLDRSKPAEKALADQIKSGSQVIAKVNGVGAVTEIALPGGKSSQ